MNIQEIKEQAEQLQMEHTVKFSFPLGINNDKTAVVFGGHELEISRGGMNLLLQLLYEFVDRKRARDLYQSGMFYEFVEYINQCRTMQESAQLWRKNQTFTLATNKGKVYGVLVNYNPKLNTEVLNTIVDNNLGNNITRIKLDYERMSVFFKHDTTLGIEFGLDISNGETGHTAYSYNFYIYENEGDYTFSSPNYSRRKHLGNLGLVDDDLQAIFAEVKEIKFEFHILNTEAKEYVKLLKGNSFEKLHETIEEYKDKKVYALLGRLHSLSSQRGWKTVCKQALDRIYSDMMEYI